MPWKKGDAMNKLKITIVTIGHMPPNLNRQKIENWESSIFELTGGIESYTLPIDSDGNNWEFSDEALKNVLPNHHDGDFLIAIVNVPIQENYFARVPEDNKVVFTFYETKEILGLHNIPLENVIYLMIYTCALIYLSVKAQGKEISLIRDWSRFFHDETRGCPFDMNGIKSEIIYACDSPTICSDCLTKFRNGKVSIELIDTINQELRKIKKPLFYRASDFVKNHPIASLIITTLTALILGVSGSIIGSYIFEWLRA